MNSKLEALVVSTEKAFGRGILYAAQGQEPAADVRVTPTGFPELDTCLGIGGLPKGRLIEILGPSPAPQRILALSVIKQAQFEEGNLGAVVAYVDVSHALNLREANNEGIDGSRLLVSQPDCGEQAMDVVEALVRSGQVALIVVDSVDNLVPKGELDGETLETSAGLRARLMSRSMRKLCSLAYATGTTLVFLNTTPGDLEALKARGYVATAAGNALKFYASIRLLLRSNDNPYDMHVRVIKNKLAPPYESCYLRREEPNT